MEGGVRREGQKGEGWGSEGGNKTNTLYAKYNNAIQLRTGVIPNVHSISTSGSTAGLIPRLYSYS